ncbi:hypothetical protein [Aquimarina sp. SS2-1]|uniref:hypothetical protein n=1 Tax=Aquimarina besae TaxID=3342247 RepID=UPI00366E055B
MPSATDTKTTSTKTPQTISPKQENVPGISKEVIDELSNEVNNMLSFAVYNGIIINTEVNALIQKSTVDDLINAHNLLCKNIAPATPKSIHYTKQLNQQGKGKTLFGKLPLVRNLIILAIFFLATFIISSLSPDVNDASLDKGVLNNNGISLLLNLSFLASVSGLGVLFYLLKSVSISAKNSTLVPEDTIYYIAMIILGVIAGLISSEIISFYKTDPNDINLFNKSVLALIGGFSSDAIFSILQGIIDRIKAIFIPSTTAT